MEPVCANKYKLVTASNSDILQHAVERLLNKGWLLYGNPFSDSTEVSTCLCQAMVWTLDSDPSE